MSLENTTNSFFFHIETLLQIIINGPLKARSKSGNESNIFSSYKAECSLLEQVLNCPQLSITCTFSGNENILIIINSSMQLI
jgi:hypothetical protein